MWKKEQDEKLKRTDIHFAPTKKKIDSTSCNNVIKKKKRD